MVVLPTDDGVRELSPVDGDAIGVMPPNPTWLGNSTFTKFTCSPENYTNHDLLYERVCQIIGTFQRDPSMQVHDVTRPRSEVDSELLSNVRINIIPEIGIVLS